MARGARRRGGGGGGFLGGGGGGRGGPRPAPRPWGGRAPADGAIRHTRSVSLCTFARRGAAPRRLRALRRRAAGAAERRAHERPVRDPVGAQALGDRALEVGERHV